MGAPGRCRIDPAHLCLNSCPGGDDDDGGGGDDGGACGGDGDGADTTTNNRNSDDDDDDDGDDDGRDGDGGGDGRKRASRWGYGDSGDPPRQPLRLRLAKQRQRLEWDRATRRMTAPSAVGPHSSAPERLEQC